MRVSRTHGWRMAAAGLPLLLILFFLYRAPGAWLLTSWRTDPYYTHGAPVLALAVGLAVWRLHKHETPRASTTWMLAIPAALTIYLIGFLRHDPYLLIWSGLGLAAATAIALGGPARLRLVALPLALAGLALPLPWVSELGLIMQQGATKASAGILSLGGVGFASELYTFTADGIAFEVTAACSGFQSAVSLFAIAAVIVAFFPMPQRRRLAVLAIAIPLALMLNIARILAVVGVALNWGPAAAEGFFHGWSGGILFILQTLVLLAIAGALRRPARGWWPAREA